MNIGLRHIKSIFMRELTGYFNSALAYVFLVIFLVLLGFFTFYVSGFFENGQADLSLFFSWHPWLYMLLAPAITMRLWADERRQGTLELLMTFPITPFEAIMGKFLASWFFVGIALSLTFPIIITVAYLGSPDAGAIFCGYAGSFLMAGAFLSIGIMSSSLTNSPVVSFLVSTFICLFFNLAGYPPVTQAMKSIAPDQMVNFVSGLSMLTHVASINRGVISLFDLSYFVSVMGFMLFVNSVSLENRQTL